MPNEVTPEEILSLARECMPDTEPVADTWVPDWVHRWHIKDGKVQRQHRAIPYIETFGGEDPAHAWAVETWLFDPEGKPYDFLSKDTDRGHPYCICWDGDLDEVFPDNLSAAIAVLRRKGGK